MLGAIEIDVTLRSGAHQKVKVQQLPIRLLGEWSRIIQDEAALVELYCNKIDNVREAKLLKLSGEAVAIYQKLQAGQSGADLEKVSNDLAMTRAEIAKINSEPRWDDELTPESHDEIVRIGYELNRPRFDLWLSNRQNAIGHLKDAYKQYLPEHPLVAGAESPKASTPAGTPEKASGSATLSPTPALP